MKLKKNILYRPTNINLLYIKYKFFNFTIFIYCFSQLHLVSGQKSNLLSIKHLVIFINIMKVIWMLRENKNMA